MLDIYNRNDLDELDWYSQVQYWPVDIRYMLKDYQIAWDFQ